MAERLSPEQFTNYIAQQPMEKLPELAQSYHNKRNSGIRRLAVGAVAAGGVVATVLATNGDAGRYIAMGELAVASLSSLNGLDRIFTGRRGEQTARERLQTLNEAK